MTLAQTFDAGIFRCECVGRTPSGLRWKVQNTNTSVVHFTYGTAEEVRKACEQQTAAWERKATLPARGSGWRTSPKKPH